MSSRIVHGFCVRRQASASTRSHKESASWLQVQRRSNASSPRACDRSRVAMASIEQKYFRSGVSRVDSDQHTPGPTGVPPFITDKGRMPASHDQFFLQHGGEIREALIMIEGDDGGFELLAHGWLAGNKGDESILFALMRSCNTDRVHLLVHDPDRDPRHVYHWHR